MSRPKDPFNGGLVPREEAPTTPLGQEVSWWPDTGYCLLHHPESACEPPCPIHRPGEHHMVTWRLHWRDDRGIFERICPHGVGHPDPDSTRREVDGVHGCDGCCRAPEDAA